MVLEWNLLNGIRFAINVASITVSAMVLLCIIGIRIYRKDMADRVSLRLTTLVTTSDLLYHICLILVGTVANMDVWKVFRCLSYAFLTMSILYTTLITVNLQLVMIHHWRGTDRYQLAYYLIPPIPAFTLAIVCYFLPWTKLAFGVTRVDIVTLALTILFLIVMIYSIFVCTTIILRLRSARRISMSIDSTPSSGVKNPQLLTRAVIRISLYPLILCVVGIPFVYIMIIQLSTQVSSYSNSYYTCEYSIALLGVLNGIAFIFDPVLYHCYSQIRKDSVTRYRVEEQYVKNGKFNFRRWFTRVFLLPKDEYEDSENTMYSSRDDSLHWKGAQQDEETLRLI
ncbi:hypothetical protein K7432_014424 [Basidiobolus ranarum]|uniref:G-protein coupled receptors family 1 profile domain-containing protein n=1 Tax=Basidiobolus ranarum TaxID=34480 RepID=A0ABR2VQD1_9FUNG